MTRTRITHLDPTPQHAIETRDAIQYVIAKTTHETITEKRLQGLLFLAALNWYDSNNSPDQLLNVEFKKVRRGIFSIELRNSLKEIGLRNRPEFSKNGFQKTVYDIRTCDTPTETQLSGENPTEAAQILCRVVESTETVSTTDLMDFCISEPEVDDLITGNLVEL